MSDQFDYDDEPAIINANEPHMACLLLLDTSGSMQGEPIYQLNNAINDFKQELLNDPKTADIFDIAIVAFNDSIEIAQNFAPIEQMLTVQLNASGGTIMTPAIETAIDLVNERYRFYLSTGTQPYKPWIIMISDGRPQDSIDKIAGVIHENEEKGKFNFWTLGVKGYDHNTNLKLSGKRTLKLEGYKFFEFFDWVNKSMRSISQSSPGEKPKGILLPDAVDKDTDDLM